MPKPQTAILRFFLFISFLIGGITLNAQTLVANFGVTATSGCAPLTVTFSDLSSGNPTSWSWDFGNGQLSTARNPVINYAVPGTYTVRLIVKDSTGIDDEIKTNYITVFPAPAVSFSANTTTSCAPATIQFTDLSTSPGGSALTGWLWDFGDGTTSTAQNPAHVYTNIGFYTVSLQVTNSNGCKAFGSIGRYIRIVNGVDVNFAFSQPTTCQAPFLVNFNDQSSGPGALSYTWNFGNGNTSTLQNPSSVYNAAGTYTVQLNVQSDLGCSGSLTKDIVVAGKTTDFAVPPTICIGQTVTFQNNSSPAPASSSWSFSDGSISSQINPVKTFLSGGTYQVKLINNYGNCSDSITKTITVISNPTVAFSSDDSVSCNAPFTVQFSDQSPAASTWLWDFGDGTSSTQQNPSHTYSAPGFYDVSLNITLAGGCTNTIIKPQYIRIQQIAAAIANAPGGGCVPYTFSPIPSIQSADSIVSYEWDLGEPGAIYNTQFPTHTYNTAGNYTITLIVTSLSGCKDTITIPNGVLTGTVPTAAFTFLPDDTCASATVQFTDNSTTTPGASVQWSWDFGDGGTSTSQNPQHVFEDTGSVVVRLTITNNGCPGNTTQTIKVRPPVAKFGYQVDCNNRLAVTFSDSSLTDPAYGPISYQWDFGDGSPVVTTASPVHTYAALGNYTATLTVTNGPCSYQVSKSIVLTNEQADFSISKNPVCRDEVFTLSAITNNPASIRSYTWTIDTVTVVTPTGTVDRSIPAYGNYDVTLTIEDVNGCTSTKTVAGYIKVNGPLANFTAVSSGGCVNKLANFNDLSADNGTPITEWTWNFGDGTQQTFTAPPFSHVYSQTGIYNVSLFVKNSSNCTDHFTLNNAVLITSPLAAFRADTFFCPAAPLQFVDTSNGVSLNYTWEFGDGGTSSLQNPTHSYLQTDSFYTVKLKVRDTVGCEDSVTKVKYIHILRPTAAFSIADSSGICLPLLTSFTFGGSGYASFLWDFGDGTSTTAQNPTHFYNTYGTFTPKLYLQGPGGCLDSAQATVNAYNPNVISQIVPDQATACNSLNVNFNVTTPPGFAYSFYFGDGLVDSSGQSPLPHLYPSPGNFSPFLMLTDKFGCLAPIFSPVIHVYGALPLFDKSIKAFCDTGQVLFTNFTLTNDPITGTTWDFDDGTTSTDVQPIHFFGAPGTYAVRLIVNTQNNCTSIYADTIRVYRTPVVSLTGKDTICINSTENFAGTIAVPDTAINWQWSFGNGTGSQDDNVQVTYSSAGNYNIDLVAKNLLGCADTTSHPVTVVPLPTANAVTNPITIVSGASTQLNMNYTGPIVSYAWLPTDNLDCFNCPQPAAKPRVTTDYAVQITDRYGCKNSGNITVKVICSGQNFFVPNTFSPNGDGVNDVFYLRGTGLFRVNSLMVFNRWGEVVFEKKNILVNDASAGWNGTYRGKKANPDVYVYQVEIICDNGELIKYSGNIALIQ